MNAYSRGGILPVDGGVHRGAPLWAKQRRWWGERRLKGAAAAFGRQARDLPPRYVPTDEYLSLEKRVSPFNQVVEVVQLPTIPNPTKGPVVDVPDNYLGVRAMLIGGVEGELIPQSVYHPDRVLTAEYWDTLAILPSIMPEGVLGVYGLGGGSLARICDFYYPSQKILSWDVDPAVVELAKKWMGLEWIQKRGNLIVHTGDCFSNSATVKGGFAGLVVDLFDADGLLANLKQKSTWEIFKNRLMTDGRVLANMDEFDEERCCMLLDVFEDGVSFKVQGTNLLALTGPPPPEAPTRLPDDLKNQCLGWLSMEELVGRMGQP